MVAIREGVPEARPPPLELLGADGSTCAHGLTEGSTRPELLPLGRQDGTQGDSPGRYGRGSSSAVLVQSHELGYLPLRHQHRVAGCGDVKGASTSIRCAEGSNCDPIQGRCPSLDQRRRSLDQRSKGHDVDELGERPERLRICRCAKPAVVEARCLRAVAELSPGGFRACCRTGENLGDRCRSVQNEHDRRRCIDRIV